MESIFSLIPDTPLVSFTILVLVVLLIPPIFERIRLPGLVGLLVAGVVLGQNGLQVLNPSDETIKLLSDIGKIYLMFVAGLEIDLKDFRQKRNRSLSFGLATFLFPLIVGLIVGRAFGFGWNSSVLIGSLLASHTLLGYPIVDRLGVVRNEAVTITIGATIFTDISALLVLAICVSIHGGDFSAETLILQLVNLALYAAFVLFGFDWLGKEYFRRTGDAEGNQFLFVLSAVFLASVGAELVNVEQIVGAFLAGLAVNDVVGRGPVKEKVEFLGSTMFIPFFFVGMGLLINVPAFVSTLTSGLALTASIVFALLGSKFLAALVTKLRYGYSKAELFTMWSLSMPQVAATLAAALAAYQAINGVGDRLITENVLNSVIVLMLVTSLFGPILTAQFAPKIRPPQPTLTPESLADWGLGAANPSKAISASTFTIVVPIYNPLTEKYLMEMGAFLAGHESGHLVPLSIALAHVHMDDPQLEVGIQKAQKMLNQATNTAQILGVTAYPQLRIDDDVAQGITRTAREVNANLVVMGWSQNQGIRARLFGTILDQVFWSSHCPVAAMRLLTEPSNIYRILVPVKSITPLTIQTIRFAQLFANANQASVTLLHIFVQEVFGLTQGPDAQQIQQFEQQLSEILSQAGPTVGFDIQTVIAEDPAEVILRMAQSFDMVVLRSFRRRTAGGLTVSNVATRVVKELTCSLVMFGEPHS
ncbi:cation:proton antiporter [Spirulina subsalsa]|uniref:cation:proton antiporter domain-containing protein n=1 Tax=Spirulina subsalsa TaxID=54311 RepID=UPI0002F16362|nr:cation:proton antiporter [Spirulina subsalsa]